MTRQFATTVVAVAFSTLCIAASPRAFAQTGLAQGGAASSPAKPGQLENKDAPVQIEAATLEVHDKSKTATFSGNVQVVQGDTTMRCRSLVVFYGQEVGIGERAERRLQARPGKPRSAGRKALKISAALKRAAA